MSFPIAFANQTKNGVSLPDVNDWISFKPTKDYEGYIDYVLEGLQGKYFKVLSIDWVACPTGAKVRAWTLEANREYYYKYERAAHALYSSDLCSVYSLPTEGSRALYNPVKASPEEILEMNKKNEKDNKVIQSNLMDQSKKGPGLSKSLATLVTSYI